MYFIGGCATLGDMPHLNPDQAPLDNADALSHPDEDNGWEKEDLDHADDDPLDASGRSPAPPARRNTTPLEEVNPTTPSAQRARAGAHDATLPSPVKEGREIDSGGASGGRRLTALEFQGLAQVPPAVEWFANIQNPRTRRAYRIDLEDFMEWSGVRDPEEFRGVTRAHVIGWRKSLEARGLAGSTIRRKLSALASMFDYLCEKNAVGDNPVHGVKRPPAEGNEGKTPAISDAQARRLLDAPPEDTLKGLRDRAILAVLLYHGLRRDELCKLRVMDVHPRRGVPHLRVRGKGGKTRYLPLHTVASDRLHLYMEAAGHAPGSSPENDTKGPLFRPVRDRTRENGHEKPLTAEGLYECVVKKYAAETGLPVEGFCTHSLRATAATAALEGGADLTRVQGWLGHANVSTTRLYDKRGSKPEDSPTWRIQY